MRSFWVVAAALVVTGPAFGGGFDFRKGPPQDRTLEVRQSLRELANAVENLQDEIADLPGKSGYKLYQQADEILQDIQRCQQQLQGFVKREQLYDQYRRLDVKIHQLMERVDKKDERTGMTRALWRVRQADRQWHAAITQGDSTSERINEAAVHQASALVDEARELQRYAKYSFTYHPEAKHIHEQANRLVVAAEHFLKSAQGGESREHLKRDYEEVNKLWKHLTDDINNLKGEGYAHLRGRAQRVDSVQEYLHRFLGMEGSRGRIQIRLGGSGLEIRGRDDDGRRDDD